MVRHNPEQCFTYISQLLQELLQELGTVREFVDSLTEEQAQLQERLKETRQQLHRANYEGRLLQEQLQQARDAPATTGAAARFSERISKSGKLPDPEPFSGQRSELALFIASLRLKLLANCNRFPTAQERLTYAFSRLTGNARNQILPYITATGVNLEDVEALIAHLELAFGNLDRKGTAQRQIQTLRQHNRKFNAYFAEFNRYIHDTGYDDEVVKSALMDGLSEELKAMLVPSNTQDMSLQDLVSHCQKLDNQYRVNLNASSQPSGLPSLPPPGPPSAWHFPNTPSAARNLGSWPALPSSTSSPLFRTRRLLTPEEKQRRHEKGLCLYCGQPGHLVMSCPSKPQTTVRPFFTSATTNIPVSSTSAETTSAENERFSG